MYRLGPISPFSNEVDSVNRISDGACIPFCPGNTDYENYLNWLAEGNTPEPSEPPLLPQEVPMTPAEKLAAAGLSVDELKELLGL